MKNEEQRKKRLQAMGSQVSSIRKHHELTQQQLAEMSGVAVNMIARIERGEYNASVDVLGRLCSAINESLIIEPI